MNFCIFYNLAIIAYQFQDFCLSSLPICILFIYVSYLIAIAVSFDTMLKKSCDKTSLPSSYCCKKGLCGQLH